MAVAERDGRRKGGAAPPPLAPLPVEDVLYLTEARAFLEPLLGRAVPIRTMRMWLANNEEVRLPVHRNPGEKGRYWFTKPELVEWARWQRDHPVGTKEHIRGDLQRDRPVGVEEAVRNTVRERRRREEAKGA